MIKLNVPQNANAIQVIAQAILNAPPALFIDLGRTQVGGTPEAPTFSDPLREYFGLDPQPDRADNLRDVVVALYAVVKYLDARITELESA